MSTNNSDTQFLPGVKPVKDALEMLTKSVDTVFIANNRQDRQKLVDLCKSKKVRFSLVEEKALTRMLGSSQHQGILARMSPTQNLPFEDLLVQAFEAPLPLIVALDQVLDPGNIGALARTLYALGAAGLVVPTHNSAFLGPGALRSSAGALQLLPVSHVVNLSKAVELAAMSGFHTYSAQMEGKNALTEKLQIPALLVLGSEDKGIRPGVHKHCMDDLSIPFLRTFDSLNVAQAGAILCSCFVKNISA